MTNSNKRNLSMSTSLKGFCPYCNYELTYPIADPGINCPSCTQRVIIRNDALLTIDQAKSQQPVKGIEQNNSYTLNQDPIIEPAAKTKIQKEESGFVKAISLILNWFFGVIFLIAGIGAFFASFGGNSSIIAAFSYLLLGAICIPPLKHKLESLIQLNIKPWPKCFLVIILLIVGGLASPHSSSSDTSVSTSSSEVTQSQSTSYSEPIAETPKMPKIGETLRIGHFEYKVKNIKWKKRIGDAYFGESADARFLIIRMSVKNIDDQSRMMEQLELEDENGNNYEQVKTMAGSMTGEGKSGFLLSLNPNVQTNAVLVYDVPPQNHYSLVLTGGYFADGSSKKVKLN